ncbi:MAG: hypothetical protein QXS21_00870 [Thermoproteota archaeon]|nr:hypothetical protein [Candidatus Brockarchaeota archaeon]MBO3762632.1 hypothetical protein [Candidatus Brockarchaeota archaeon]MBO3768589.1 hypothetical protein [Candidatus Brockarchaeota archaeon]MBO3800965.1 hypothetical protein [Candidatus Brockarchaeota archaeon]
MAVRSSFILIKTNKDYELDAYLEAFSLLVTYGEKFNLFGSPNDGQVILVASTKLENDRLRELVERLNRNINRYVKRAFKVDIIARIEELTHFDALVEYKLFENNKILLADGPKKAKKKFIESLKNSELLNYIIREKGILGSIVIYPFSCDFVGIGYP